MSERVEVVWVKAAASADTGNCVEMAELPDGDIGVRDSKNPEGGMLRFNRGEVRAWLDGAGKGEFNQFA